MTLEPHSAVESVAITKAALHVALVRMRNVDDVPNVEGKRIQDVPRFPVLSRFRDRIAFLISVDILDSTDFVAGRSPVAYVVFVMPIEGTCVEEQELLGSSLYRSIAVPTVTVDQAWLEDTALFLQRQQELGHDLNQDHSAKSVELAVRHDRGRNLHVLAQMPLIECRPATLPLVNLLDYWAMTGLNVEAEFTSR